MNIKDNNNYKDERGAIEMVLENCSVGSISRISTNPGHSRALHYHKKDGHTIIINEGQILMYERPTGSKGKPDLFILNKGDIHFTGPMIDHQMFMPCYTVFDCYSLLPRDSEGYESETVRFSDDLRDIHNNWKD
jgi:hypothetical protein